MFRLFVILVRTSYLLAALVALVFVTPQVVDFARAIGRPVFMRDDRASLAALGAVLLVAFIVPAARAVLRLVRRRELIPAARLREAPIVATLVWLCGAFGSALLLLVAWILLTTLPEPRDVNFAAPVMLGLMSLALALLTGEVVLVGKAGRFIR